MARRAVGKMTGVATSVNPIQDIVLDAVESRTPLRIAGRSHWIDAGRPVAATRIASLATHDGVVDYVPGDLTITVKAGTTLDHIDRITRAEDQWLPLVPFGAVDGTIGATIATGSFGPLAHGFGRARDLVLGVEFITGEGTIVRGGGRVVKNVAGFDLVRLVTGSWGTLGIITELTLRLYSRPRAAVSLCMSIPDNAIALAQRISKIVTAPVTPSAMELISGPVAAQIGLPRRAGILIELGGNSASVAAQLAALERLGGVTEVADPWQRLRLIEGETPRAVLRFSCLPSRIGAVWSALAHATIGLNGVLLHATPAFGIVRCILPADVSGHEIRRIVGAAPDVTVIYERLPSELWDEVSPSVVSDPISQGIMKAFDPHRLLNPGIMGPTS